MKKEEEVTKMSALSFMCAMAGHAMWAQAQAKLGMDPDKLLESKAAKFAKRSAEESFNGKPGKAGQSMALKLMMDTIRIKRLPLSDPTLARQLAADGLRQCVSSFAQGPERSRAKAVLEETIAAMGGAGAPSARHVELLLAGDGPDSIGFMMGSIAALTAATDVEITLRAASGDRSWRDWVESAKDIKKPADRALWKAWGASLEASHHGESSVEAIKAELTAARQELGPQMDLGAMQKSAKTKFGKSSINNVDGGKGEAFVKDFGAALASLKQGFEASASGEGLAGRLAERRELSDAAKPGSKAAGPDASGSSRL